MTTETNGGGFERRTSAQAEALRRRVDVRWHALAMAEQRGQPRPVLERMYGAYLHALDELVALHRAHPGRLGGELAS